jgi:hypothetical protein
MMLPYYDYSLRSGFAEAEREGARVAGSLRCVDDLENKEVLFAWPHGDRDCGWIRLLLSLIGFDE